MVKLATKNIKSKKDGKEYTLYRLESGDFATKWFFPNNLSIEEIYQLYTMVGDNE